MEKDCGKSRFDEGEMERENQEQVFGHVEFDLLSGHLNRGNHWVNGYV